MNIFYKYICNKYYTCDSRQGSIAELVNGDISMKDGHATFPKPELGEPYLLTPGPLTTSIEVKRAMLRDWGSWDEDFRTLTADLRQRLLALLGPSSDGFECVPMQGSGTFGVEAMLGTFLPRDGKVLVLSNGAYGLRAAEAVRYLGRQFSVIDKGYYLPPRGEDVSSAIAADPASEPACRNRRRNGSGWQETAGRQHVSVWRD